MLRRDIAIGLFASVTGSAIAATMEPSRTPTTHVGGLTAAEIAAEVQPTDPSFPPGDVRRYGALGNWNGSSGADDTAALQQALKCNATIFLPPGRFRISSTLLVAQAVQIFGSGGDASSIDPQDCDGLSFAKSNGIGPTVLSNFALRGNGAKNCTGIKCSGTVNQADQVNGIRIENMRIHYFHTAMSVRTFWHSSIRGCVFNNVYNGIEIHGQSTVITIEGCQLVCDKRQGTGTAVGVAVNSTADYDPHGTTLRPESILVRNSLIYGFDHGVDLVNVLDARVIENVLDNCGSRGVQLTYCDGTCTISDNWIALGPGRAVTGIDLIPVAAPSSSVRNIRGNYVVALGGHADSYGISVGGRQNDSIIDGNTFTGLTAADIYVNGATNSRVINNRCASAATFSIYNALSGKGHTVIDGNSVVSLIFVHPSANGGTFRIGNNDGLYSTYLQGSLILRSGSMTAGVKYSDLPGAPPGFSTARQCIKPRLIVHTPPSNIGTLWGVATDTDVTVTCTLATDADTEITFECLGVPVFRAP
jgi:hypothetical protein